MAGDDVSFVGDGEFAGDGGAPLELVWDLAPWTPLHNCPGRYVLKGKSPLAPLPPRALAERAGVCADAVVAEVTHDTAPLPGDDPCTVLSLCGGGGLVSYHKRSGDGTFFVHTLNTASGLARLLRTTGLAEDVPSAVSWAQLPPDCVAAVVSAAAFPIVDLLRLRRVSRAWAAAVSAHLAGARSVDVYPWRAAVDDSAAAVLARLCPALERLSLCGCVRLSDAALAAFGAGCPRLRDLNVSCTAAAFSLEALRALAAQCAELQSIELSGCHAVGPDAVRRYFADLTELHDDEDEALGSPD